MDLQIDSVSGDLVLENGDLALSRDSDAIGQHILQRLRMFQGEWFLDESQGTPYYQSILGKAPNLQVVDAILKDRILGTPGVVELREFELGYEGATRKLTVRWKAILFDGAVDFGSLIVGGTEAA